MFKNIAKSHLPWLKPLTWESKVTYWPGSCMSSEDINHFCCMTWTCIDQATVWMDKTRAGRLWASTLIYLLHAAYSPYAMIHQIYLKSSRKPKREFSRNACDEQSKEEFSFWEKGTATSASRLREIFLEFTYIHDNTRTTSCWHDLVFLTRSQYLTQPQVFINFKMGAKKVRSPCRS